VTRASTNPSLNAATIQRIHDQSSTTAKKVMQSTLFMRLCARMHDSSKSYGRNWMKLRGIGLTSKHIFLSILSSKWVPGRDRFWNFY